MIRPLRTSSGQANAPILVFAGIVSLSIVFFFVFTRPSADRPAAPNSQTAGTNPADPPTATGQGVEKDPGTTAPPPPPPVQPPKSLYTRSTEFLQAFSQKLESGKMEDALTSVSEEVPTPRRDFLQKVVTAGFRPQGGSKPWKEIGRMSGVERWELPMVKADVPETPASNQRSSVLVDLKLSREEGYRITGLRFSPGLVQAIDSVIDPALTDPPDALSVSHDFITELLAMNFKGARKITDGGKVSHEKLAGLCIVFEEGEYTMMPGSSLNVTAATDDRAWALVRVRSDKLNQESEFGVQMSKAAKGGGEDWKVDSLEFSKMLQGYVRSTEAGKVYYTPFVKNPNGGESLVVYFEYDKSELTARGLKQMEIVSSLLKSDPARKMRLSGHADGLGTEDYNYILSQKRAESVRAKLIELGVDPQQIESRGFGTQAPLDPNRKDDGSDNPEGRSRNRRTEIYLDF